MDKPFLVPNADEITRGLIHTIRDYLTRAESERPTAEVMIGAIRWSLDAYEQELLKIRARQKATWPPEDAELRSSRG